MQRVRSRVLLASVLFFMAAFGFRMVLYFAFPNYGMISPREMERVARCWAETGQLCNPYATPTGPTAHVAPVYPVLLGSLYRAFGAETAQGRFAQAALSWTLCGIRSALLIPLALAIGLSFRTGVMAAALSTFFISAFHTELRGPWDAPLSALFLMGLTWLAARFSRSPDFRVRSAALLGVASGCAALENPATLPIIAGYCLAAGYVYRPPLRQYSGWLLTLGIAGLLVLIPWAARNQRVLGSPLLFRSNFGMELAVAYNPEGATSSLESAIVRYEPGVNEELSRRIASMGEVAFNKEEQRQAIDRIKQDPRRAARMFLAHLVYFWFPPAENRIFRVILAGLTLTSVFGMVLLWKHNRRPAALILIIWLSFPLIYYILVWSSRYRYPMEWSMILASASLLDVAWCKIRIERDNRLPARICS
jgi:hypothetical protein